MIILESSRFIQELNSISDCMSKNNLNSAIEFQKQLKDKLNIILLMPFICRKSLLLDDESIRDFIFKSYVVPYLIYDKNTRDFIFKNHVMQYLIDDENIRDFIFKGYVILYLIDKDTIVLLGIYKESLWNLDKELV